MFRSALSPLARSQPSKAVSKTFICTKEVSSKITTGCKPIRINLIYWIPSRNPESTYITQIYLCNRTSYALIATNEIRRCIYG
jgi:hypothetical protein